MAITVKSVCVCVCVLSLEMSPESATLQSIFKEF